ncbi:hypothetical protein CCR78_05785 [Rhodovulum imhoffii]|nr:hypothetical protein [Rhodovulum imhoffii]
MAWRHPPWNLPEVGRSHGSLRDKDTARLLHGRARDDRFGHPKGWPDAQDMADKDQSCFYGGMPLRFHAP